MAGRYCQVAVTIAIVIKVRASYRANAAIERLKGWVIERVVVIVILRAAKFVKLAIKFRAACFDKLNGLVAVKFKRLNSSQTTIDCCCIKLRFAVARLGKELIIVRWEGPSFLTN